MDKTLLELARVTQDEIEQTLLTTRAYMARHRNALSGVLQALGFDDIKFTRFSKKEPMRPEIVATKEGRDVCICFAEMVESFMELEALSEEQCSCCDAAYGDCDVYYASMLLDRQNQQLDLIPPVAVKQEGSWQTNDMETGQYLPLTRRQDVDRYSPLLGGAALLKLDKLLIPYVLENGMLPRFSIENLFADMEQGESGYYALMCGDAPTHLMLVQEEEGRPMFRRPFFFGNSRPVSELELIRCLDARQECGVTELMDGAGNVLYAECLEAVLYPDQFIYGRHYMWTLSLVANGFRIISDASRAESFIYQEPSDTRTQLCGAITHIEEVVVDARHAYVWTICPLPHNEDIEVQVYVGAALARATQAVLPRVGDVVEVDGYLHASPDSLLDETVSWQDSGEVAAMQETHELETQSRDAYRQHEPYSLAHAVVASVFAGAGYEDMLAPVTHTRRVASFIMRHDSAYTAMLFLDVAIGDEPQQFAFTDEQIAQVCEAGRNMLGDELHAHRCLVRIDRCADGYDVSLRVEPPCPHVSAATELRVPLPPLVMPGVDEAQVSRILCNAICRQSWGTFASVAHEDVSYTSLVNGVKIVGKVEFIRYMAERKLLWEEQKAWQGMSMDTGTVEYEGVRRACFMITCYGRKVGAAVAKLRDGRIAEMVTLPLEVNDSFVKDAECSEPQQVFHPMRGHLTPYSDEPTPLQSFAISYLQECMSRKTGFRGATGSLGGSFISDGVEFTLHANGARWVKLLRNDPSFCDMAFTYCGRVYAICAVEAPLHPENGGDIRRIAEELLPERDTLLRVAEEQDLIPCIFPVQRDHSPNPKITWNLWDARTLEPVAPIKETGVENAPPSKWEVIYAAITEVVRLLPQAKLELVSCHDMPDLLPHIWFRDTNGQLGWIAIRPHLTSDYQDCDISAAEQRALDLLPGYPALAVDAEPCMDEVGTRLATTRDSMLRVKVSPPRPLR